MELINGLIDYGGISMGNRRKILTLFCVYGVAVMLVAAGLSLILSSPFYIEKKACAIATKSANQAFGEGNYVICKIPAEYCLVETLENGEMAYTLLPGSERYLPSSKLNESRFVGVYVPDEYVIMAIPISAFSPEKL